jgi:hypothetical protein
VFPDTIGSPPALKEELNVGGLAGFLCRKQSQTSLLKELKNNIQ